MKDMFEEDKIILKKGVFLSILAWSAICYALIFLLNLVGIYFLTPKTPTELISTNVLRFLFGLLILGLITLLITGVIFYIALKKNLKRFGLVKYNLRLTYLLYISIFMVAYAIGLNLILTGKFNLSGGIFWVFSIIMCFIISALVKE